MYGLRQISTGLILKQRGAQAALIFPNIAGSDLEWVSIVEGTKPAYNSEIEFLKFTDVNNGGQIDRTYNIILF